jgi:stearoyl-CoA desaturase (delta-9 desaturase)
MQLKRLRAEQESISWPEDNQNLPIISWQSCTILSHNQICPY